MIELDFTKPAPKPASIEECHAVIEALWTFCGNLQKGLELLKQEVMLLKQENAELKERLNSNSNNSSKPPSTDRFKKNKPKKPSNRKQGGQPGHTGVSRRLVPTEQVNQVVSCPPPKVCGQCAQLLIIQDKIARHQVYDIPLPRYDIIEYQIGYAHCAHCQTTYSGTLPSKVGKRGFGTRVHAVISLLTSKFRLSKRQALSLLRDFYDIPISVGSISNIEHRVSTAIEPAHKEIRETLSSEKVVHIDETGFKQSNRNGWAWLLTSKQHSFFKLDFSRGKKVAKLLIGDFNARTIISDRYPAYDYIPERSHQVCWAHLKRDFQKIAERGGISGVIGRKLLKHYGRIFAYWKATLEKEYSDDKRTRKKREYLKRTMRKELRRGFECDHKMTSRTCRKILDVGESLWLFLGDKLVPATNNLAEQQLRPLVIAKKLSFGVKSERGARFIERIFSITATFQQQQKNPLVWLQTTINNYFDGQAIPSIS